MKKNILIVLLIFCLSLILTACGSKPADSEAVSQPGSSVSENSPTPEISGDPEESTVPAPSQPADSEITEDAPVEESPKSLVVYFSWSGNTRNVAEAIKQQTGSDMFELIPVTPYSEDYNTVLNEARTEQRNNARPEITGEIENIADYDTIYVGFPNWWGDMPMILYSFFDSYDLSGKTIIPFATSGGSGMGKTDSILQRLCPGDTKWLPGKRMRSRESVDSVGKWISSLKY